MGNHLQKEDEIKLDAHLSNLQKLKSEDENRSLQSDQKKFHAKDTFPCDLCGKNFFLSQKDLESHQELNHLQHWLYDPAKIAGYQLKKRIKEAYHSNGLLTRPQFEAMVCGGHACVRFQQKVLDDLKEESIKGFLPH